MTREERCDAIKFFKEVSEKEVDNAKYSRLAIEALEHDPCKISEYDKDHIWYKGCQYISLRRFLEVKKEIYEKGYAEGQRALTAWMPLPKSYQCEVEE